MKVKLCMQLCHIEEVCNIDFSEGELSSGDTGRKTLKTFVSKLSQVIKFGQSLCFTCRCIMVVMPSGHSRFLDPRSKWVILRNHAKFCFSRRLYGIKFKLCHITTMFNGCSFQLFRIIFLYGPYGPPNVVMKNIYLHIFCLTMWKDAQFSIIVVEEPFRVSNICGSNFRLDHLGNKL